MNNIVSLKNLIWICAIGLAIFSGYYSVFGISKLFSGNAWSIVGMAIMLEISKLVVITFLHDHYSTLKFSFKIYLTTAASVLMIITSIGVYGYLTNSYQETAKSVYEAQNNLGLLDQKKNIFIEQKNKIDTLISQKNKRITAYDKIRISQEGSLNLQLTQKTNTRGLQKNIQNIDKSTQILSDEISSLSAKSLAISDSISNIEQYKLSITNSTFKSELGPLLYLSRVTGLSMDLVVNWFIIVLVIVFDPLAVSLVIAANHLKRIEHEKIKTESVKKINDQITDAVTIHKNIIDSKKENTSKPNDNLDIKFFDEIVKQKSETSKVVELNNSDYDNQEIYETTEDLDENITDENIMNSSEEKNEEIISLSEEQNNFYQEEKPIGYRRGISL
jgi:hypothetical protein